jgi:hypothetical protein
MENTINFDKRTQFKRLQACEDLFESLRQKHNVQFDEEDIFKKSAKRFMDVLDTEFPQQMTESDKIRAVKILKRHPHLEQMLDLQKVKNNINFAVDVLKNIHHMLSDIKKGHDGLEEKQKRASWLREWLELRDQVLHDDNYIQEAIKIFKTKVDELEVSTGMTVSIQHCTVWSLLEDCDKMREDLLKTYRVKLIDNHDYISSVIDLYSALTKENPTCEVSMSAAAIRYRENIIVDLEKLKKNLAGLRSKLFNQRRLVLLIKNSNWAAAAAKDSFLKQTDKDIKGYIEDLRQHAQELIALIQPEQAGR